MPKMKLRQITDMIEIIEINLDQDAGFFNVNFILNKRKLFLQASLKQSRTNRNGNKYIKNIDIVRPNIDIEPNLELNAPAFEYLEPKLCKKIIFWAARKNGIKPM